MRVLIVAKTRVRSVFCVGGLSADDRNVRLRESDQSYPPADTAYEVGQIWEMTYRPLQRKAPHTEDVVVSARRSVAVQMGMSKHLRGRIESSSGAPTVLFGGHLDFTANDRGYIKSPTALNWSTEFWIPDAALRRVLLNHKTYYRYGTEATPCDMPYVGAQDSIPQIAAGTLVRVSLASWLKGTIQEERCYLQLSGWFE